MDYELDSKVLMHQSWLRHFNDVDSLLESVVRRMCWEDPIRNLDANTQVKITLNIDDESIINYDLRRILHSHHIIDDSIYQALVKYAILVDEKTVIRRWKDRIYSLVKSSIDLVYHDQGSVFTLLLWYIAMTGSLCISHLNVDEIMRYVYLKYLNTPNDKNSIERDVILRNIPDLSYLEKLEKLSIPEKVNLLDQLILLELEK